MHLPQISKALLYTLVHHLLKPSSDPLRASQTDLVLLVMENSFKGGREKNLDFFFVFSSTTVPKTCSSITIPCGDYVEPPMHRARLSGGL
jgi:hypothetical protein